MYISLFFVYISFASGSQREPHFQWNIGGVGSSGVGHVHFMYISCCLCIIFRVGYAKISRRSGKFQWNMGLSLRFHIPTGNIHMEGTVSQIFDIGPRFYYMKSRKIIMKK